MSYKIRLRVENLTLEGDMSLSQHQQQELTDHLKQSGLFGGAINVGSIATILRLLATALEAVGGGTGGAAGGGSVSG